MTIWRNAKSILCLSLLVLLVASSSIAKVHAAGTKTWIGTACNGVSHDCAWSNATNWQSSSVPSGNDDVIFDNSVLNPAFSPTDDINGLAVNTLTFINAGSGANTITLGSGLLGGDLTVNNSISQAASSTTADFIKGTLILGGSVVVTGNGNNLTIGSSTSGQANDILNLNGHSLTFQNVVVPGSTPKVTINDVISGAGVVTYNGPNTQFVVNGINTYSGTTNVTASSSWLGGDIINQQPFGTSSIVVGSAAGIKFLSSTNLTFTNSIQLDGGSATSSLPISIFFAKSGAGPVSFSFPNISLLGNVRLSNDSNTTVDLTGITVNGHCVEYLTNGALVDTPYTGGPAICTTPVTPSTPTGSVSTTTTTKAKAPDTGIARIAANPLLTAFGAMAAAVVMVGTIGRLKTGKK